MPLTSSFLNSLHYLFVTTLQKPLERCCTLSFAKAVCLDRLARRGLGPLTVTKSSKTPYLAASSSTAIIKPRSFRTRSNGSSSSGGTSRWKPSEEISQQDVSTENRLKILYARLANFILKATRLRLSVVGVNFEGLQVADPLFE